MPRGRKKEEVVEEVEMESSAKERVEASKKAKNLKELNDNAYKKPADIKHEKVTILTASGTKVKHYEKATYPNGVVKSKCVGVTKNNKVVYDRGIK